MPPFPTTTVPPTYAQYGFWPPVGPTPEPPNAAEFYARQQQAMEEARKRWEQQMQHAPAYPPRGGYPYYWPPQPPRYPSVR